MAGQTVKILAWDVETLPIVGSTWRLHKTFIRHESIIENTSLVCAAWKWVGHGRMGSTSILDDPERDRYDVYDDYHVVKELHAALEEADIYLYQNGDKFDLRKFNARAAYYGLPPIPPKQSIDTLKQARKHFGFDSNRLDYLGRYLGVGAKMDTGGYELWDNIVQAKYPPVGKDSDLELAEKSVRKMVRYNRQDVRLLEAVYKEMRPYITLPNISLYLGKVVACTHCGGQDFIRYGYRYTKSARYQRYWCRSCERPFDPPRTQGRYIDAEFA